MRPPLTCECCGDTHLDVDRYPELDGTPTLCVVCAPCPVCGVTGGDCYWDGLRDVCVRDGGEGRPAP